MFRQGIRRSANQVRSTASVALAATYTRPALQLAQRNIAPLPVSISKLNRFTSFQRLYSSEAVAEQEAAPVVSDSLYFKDLLDLDVHPALIDAITKGLKYETMSEVQAKTIKPALKGTDIVAQAKTGTGKTIAFLLPMLQRMLVEDPGLARRGGGRRGTRADDVRGIVLSPTRELAEQIAVEARQLTRNTGLVVQSAVGGTQKREMLHRARREGCHLLVATPGRLNDLLQDERSGIDAPNLAALVLDEADRMLDTGFERELHEILGNLPKPEEKTRQTMLVSATIPDNVIRLARAMVRPDDFEFVQTIPENESLTHDKVPQNIVSVSSWNNMFPTLFELIDREAAKAQSGPEAKPFKAIVYLNTTSLVELSGELCMKRARDRSSPTHLRTYVINSRLTQAQRTLAADRFRAAKSGVLFSSDVTARGMHFPDVTHVIQIDVPQNRESYIHRIGRTGRQDKEGEGWLLVPEYSLSNARNVLRGLNIKQNTTLDSPAVEIEKGSDLPPMHEEMKQLFGTMSRSFLATAYSSMFGVATNKETLADDINNWSNVGWGWDTPPIVSSAWVQKMGLSRVSSMNVGTLNRERGGDHGDRDSYGRGNDREQRSSFNNDDPFSRMQREIRRDGPPSFGGRGGGGRGGQGGRGGYGGYGGRDGGRGGGRGGSGGSGGSGGRSFGQRSSF